MSVPLTVNTTTSTPGGSFSFTITGTSGSLVHTTTASLTVSAFASDGYGAVAGDHHGGWFCHVHSNSHALGWFQLNRESHLRHYTSHVRASEVQLQFRNREWWKRDADADGEHGSSDGIGAAGPSGEYVLCHAVAVVWADAAGSKVQVAEQEATGLAAGLPHAVGTGLASGLWWRVIWW